MAYYDLEEQEQISELKAWWNRWGTLIVALVVVGSLAFGGFQFWQWYKHDQAVKASGLFGEMTKAVGAGDKKKAGEIASQIVEQFGTTGYASVAALAAARMDVEAADLKAARTRLQWVLEKARDPGLKEVARLRLAAVLLEEKQYDEALKTLEQKEGETQSNLAADLRGDVFVAKGQLSEARAAYQTAFERTDAKSPFRNVLQLKIDALGDSK